MSTIDQQQSTTQQPQTTNRGGGLDAPLNHYNSSNYQQSSTQQNTQQYQFSAQQQQQNIQQPQQMRSCFGSSMQQQHNHAFYQQSKNLFGASPPGASPPGVSPPLNPQRGDCEGALNKTRSNPLIFTAFSPQPRRQDKILSNYISDEFIFKNIPTINRKLYLQNRKLHPGLASLIIAQDQAPVPQQVPNKERRNYVVQRPIRSIVTDNGLLYPIGNKESDPSFFFRRSKSSTAIEKNYREGFNDVRTTKAHIIQYSKARFPCDADGNVMADLARLHDVTNGWMIPIKVTNERTAIFGWNRYEGLEMGIIRRNVKGWGRELDVAMRYRLRVLLDWKEKGCPPAEMLSKVYPEYVHLLPSPETVEYEEQTSQPHEQHPPPQRESPAVFSRPTTTTQQNTAAIFNHLGDQQMHLQQNRLPGTDASADQQLLQPRQATAGTAQPTTIVHLQQIQITNKFGPGAITDATVIFDQSGKATQQMRDREAEVQCESTSSSSTTSSRSDGSVPPLLSAQLSAPQGATIVMNDTTFQAQSVGRGATVCNGDTTIVHQV